MKLFKKMKDGGPESRVTGYWLIEWKSVFSIALLRFEDGSRDAFHTHAFDAISFLLRGRLVEEVIVDEIFSYTKTYKPSLSPIFTPRYCLHKVTSVGRSWALTFRGPWQERWLEYMPKEGRHVVLTHGRKVCQ